MVCLLKMDLLFKSYIRKREGTGVQVLLAPIGPLALFQTLSQRKRRQVFGVWTLRWG